MNEVKVLVAQEIPQDIVEKVSKEMVRRALREEINEMFKKIHRAGFSLRTYTSSTEQAQKKAVFTDTIYIPAEWFANTYYNDTRAVYFTD